MPSTALRARFRRLLLPLALALLAGPAAATWSIVAVDRRTGEVAVASATCLSNFDLKRFVPVIVVGKGAGASQSAVDIAARSRKVIYRELGKGTTPEEILALLANIAGHSSKQYGIAAMNGSPVTFTGSGAGAAAGGVAGFDGDVAYAIQGNVLTGDEVFLVAESAFLDTPGDLGQRILAGMEAAYALGGDGRCSCSQTRPTSCGVPPPGFEKSAHVGFLLLARMGDTDGGCDSLQGCALGSYYLDLNVKGGSSDPDPVLQLRELYQDWRSARRWRPDHLASSAVANLPVLPADGRTKTRVLVRLADLNGVPLVHGGARITVTALDPLAAAMGIGPVDDNDDGSYLFDLTAPTTPGTATFEIRADDGFVTATLFPYLTVEVEHPAGLIVGGALSGAPGGERVPFVLHAPEAPGSPFVLGAELAPGSPLEPLPWPGSTGFLDPSGRAEGVLLLPPALRASLAGGELRLRALHLGGATAAVQARAR